MLPEQTRIDIGHRIRYYRTFNDLSQAEFADKLDISINFLSEIENGKKGFSSETLYRICDIFKISSDYILFGEQSIANRKELIIEYSQNLDKDELWNLKSYMNSLYDLKYN